MNKVLMGVLVAAAALMGCNTRSEQGGGAGSNTFRIVVPATATDIKQGETQTVRVALERGGGFRQPVELRMKAPAGIEVEPSNATVEAGDKGDVQLIVTVDKNAALGEYKILVKGTPDKGESTETEFRITVRAR